MSKNSVNQCLGIPNISKGGLAINPIIMLKNARNTIGIIIINEDS